MATYAIGDVQGCFDELQTLLKLISFNPEKDNLWFTGDLVNRGRQSHAVLQFVKNLNKKAVVVLGNHDLHLLAVHHGIVPLKRKDSFHDVLEAKDRDELCQWLQQQPLLHHDERLNYTLVHAGIAPQWTIQSAQKYADEVGKTLIGKSFKQFFQHMYGNEPDEWDDKLTGTDRLRLITNYFTRMRFCDLNGRLDLTYKGTIQKCPTGLMPWYKVKNRQNKDLRIIFGHWAALEGKAGEPSVFAIDTGCCWGNCLTAMRLEDQKLFNVKCKSKLKSNAE